MKAKTGLASPDLAHPPAPRYSTYFCLHSISPVLASPVFACIAAHLGESRLEPDLTSPVFAGGLPKSGFCRLYAGVLWLGLLNVNSRS